MKASLMTIAKHPWQNPHIHLSEHVFPLASPHPVTPHPCAEQGHDPAFQCPYHAAEQINAAAPQAASRGNQFC